MKVINLFGSAGAGKSTTALGVAHNLKINGYKVEYVSEYAKQLVMYDHWCWSSSGTSTWSSVLITENKKDATVDLYIDDNCGGGYDAGSIRLYELDGNYMVEFSG